MFHRATRLAVYAALAFVLLASPTANAALIESYTFQGKGNWSIDAVGSNDTPVGDLAIDVPAGSTIEKAYLYASMNSFGSSPEVVLDGTTYLPSDFTPLGINFDLQAWRADVTSQISSIVGGGGTSVTVTSETLGIAIDGEVLAIVYSHPAEVDRTISFLDGFAASGGDTTTVNYSSPLSDPTAPSFEALMSLGIGYGAQGSGQESKVDVNGTRMTSSAGGQDDGSYAAGALITAGGIGDDPTNPVDPYSLANGDPRQDDELYTLEPFLTLGDTSTTIVTENPSNDDNIFFLGVNITAEASIGSPVPEPSTYAMAAIGLLGLLAYRRFR